MISRPLFRLCLELGYKQLTANRCRASVLDRRQKQSKNYLLTRRANHADWFLPSRICLPRLEARGIHAKFQPSQTFLCAHRSRRVDLLFAFVSATTRPDGFALQCERGRHGVDAQVRIFPGLSFCGSLRQHSRISRAKANGSTTAKQNQFTEQGILARAGTPRGHDRVLQGTICLVRLRGPGVSACGEPTGL